MSRRFVFQPVHEPDAIIRSDWTWTVTRKLCGLGDDDQRIFRQVPGIWLPRVSRPNDYQRTLVTSTSSHGPSDLRVGQSGARTDAKLTTDLGLRFLMRPTDILDDDHGSR